MDRLVAPVPTQHNKQQHIHAEQHSSLQSHSSGQLQKEILDRVEHANITGKKFTSETTIESRKTSSEVTGATGTTAQGLTKETVVNVDIADEMYLEAQKKRKEAQEILESETRLCASAATLQKDLQKRLKFFKERENVEELEANQALEIERKLELERKRAHEQAVLHEQKRTEAAAQRKVAEMELETAIMEEEKHRLAAEKARTMISKFELDIEEAMFRKKREEFDVRNKTILTMDLSKYETSAEQKEVIAVPRELPEQIMVSEAHARPVTMKIPDIRIPAQQAEASIQTETVINQVTVEEEGKTKNVLEERKVQETTTRLSLQKK